MLPPFISDTKDKHPTFILASHGGECYRHSFPTLMTNTRHLFLASYGAECYRHSFQTFRPNFLSRYAPDCTILTPKMQKLPTVDPLPHPPPLGRFAPSQYLVFRFLTFKCWQVWGGRHFHIISLDTAGLWRRVWEAGISKTIVNQSSAKLCFFWSCVSKFNRALYSHCPCPT